MDSQRITNLKFNNLYPTTIKRCYCLLYIPIFIWFDFISWFLLDCYCSFSWTVLTFGLKVYFWIFVSFLPYFTTSIFYLVDIVTYLGNCYPQPPHLILQCHSPSLGIDISSTFYVLAKITSYRTTISQRYYYNIIQYPNT